MICGSSHLGFQIAKKQQTNKQTKQNKTKYTKENHTKNKQSITQIMIKPFSSKGELYFETFIHMSYA